MALLCSWCATGAKKSAGAAQESIPVPVWHKLYALVLDIALIGKMPPKQP
jgi:hypothetical protein